LILSLFEPGSRAIRVRSNVPGSILSMRNDSTDNGHLSVAEALREKLGGSRSTTSPHQAIALQRHHRRNTDRHLY
jgi:hypothetical protein